MRDEAIATERIPVDLGDGVIVQVEVAQTGREKVKAGGMPFESLTKAISKISEIVAKAIQTTSPTKATVKYGLEIGVKEGSLMATIVRGSTKANLEITLEWENKKQS